MGAVKALADDLDKVMEFDHVIRVHEDGTVSEPDGFWAPNLLDYELDTKGWTLFTHGYSGQWNYSGPVMHDSEYIGGDLATDILSNPGLYVAVVCYHTCECDGEDHHEEECETTTEGWAIARRDWHTPGHTPGTLYGCFECESECFCEDIRKGFVPDVAGDIECVYCGLQG